MKIERVIVIFVIVVVIFVTTIAMFVYKTFSPASKSDQNNISTVPVVPISGQNSTSTVPTQSIPEADSHNAIDDCIELKANASSGKEYERGSLIVTFLPQVSFELAVRSLEYFDLKPEVSKLAKDNFDLYHWLTVTVPTGEEFKWQCVLDSSEGVKRTSLNFTFKLRQ